MNRITTCLILTALLVLIIAPAGSSGNTALASYDDRVADVGAQPLTYIPLYPDWVTDGDQVGAHLGESVASAGDVNGDGYDDVIVGASDYDEPSYDQVGQAYLFYGSPSGPSLVPDWQVTAPAPESNGFFGEVVGCAGDLNGDGYDDIFVTMPNYNEGTSDVGAVYVYYGSSTGPGASPDWYAHGDSLYAHMGWDAGTAGDVNGDGYDDLIVGAYRYDLASASNAYLWYGSASGMGATGTPANADWMASSDQSLSAFGVHTGTAGDVNGDGYDDVFVAAPMYDHGETDEGMVFVWHGSATGLGDNGTPANADWRAESNQASAQLSGRWNSAPQEGGLGSAGDLNGDTYGDFVIGCNLYDDLYADEGAVFVWYGSALGLNEGVAGSPANTDWAASGGEASAWFGSSAGTAGDLDRDGYADLLVGAAYSDLGGLLNQGLVAIWGGSESGLQSADFDDAIFVASSGQAGVYFGWASATAGDVNGDGAGDVIVGAPYYNNGSSGEGRALLYFGAGGSIAGTVYCTGPICAAGPISVAAHLVPSDVPVVSAPLMSSGESYLLEGLYAGTVYVSAFLDVDHSGGPPDPGEPLAWYDPNRDGTPNPVVLGVGESLTAIDITLPSWFVYLPLVMR